MPNHWPFHASRFGHAVVTFWSVTCHAATVTYPRTCYAPSAAERLRGARRLRTHPARQVLSPWRPVSPPPPYAPDLTRHLLEARCRARSSAPPHGQRTSLRGCHGCLLEARHRANRYARRKRYASLLLAPRIGCRLLPALHRPDTPPTVGDAPGGLLGRPRHPMRSAIRMRCAAFVCGRAPRYARPRGPTPRPLPHMRHGSGPAAAGQCAGTCRTSAVQLPLRKRPRRSLPSSAPAQTTWGLPHGDGASSRAVSRGSGFRKLQPPPHATSRLQAPTTSAWCVAFRCPFRLSGAYGAPSRPGHLKATVMFHAPRAADGGCAGALDAPDLTRHLLEARCRARSSACGVALTRDLHGASNVRTGLHASTPPFTL